MNWLLEQLITRQIILRTAVLRFEAIKYLSRSEILLRKNPSDEWIMESSVFRRRELKYGPHDFNTHSYAVVRKRSEQRLNFTKSRSETNFSLRILENWLVKCPFIFYWLYCPLGPWPLIFQFHDHSTDGRTPRTSDQLVATCALSYHWLFHNKAGYKKFLVINRCDLLSLSQPF
jgi:hypothetical protein